MWERRLSADSTFCRALVGCGYLSEEQMQRAALRYRLGRSRDGGVIFWQIDEADCVRDGKIMYYRSDCHRDKQHHPAWVSDRLKRYYGYPGEIAISRCLFGLHLLAENSATDYTDYHREVDSHRNLCQSRKQCKSVKSVAKSVAVVEAEKTAVICSELYPQCLWLAAGGLSALSAERLLPLRDRHVILFPDTDPDGTAFARWQKVASEASRHFLSPVYVSPLLERQATPGQKAAKIDIADFIFEATDSQ